MDCTLLIADDEPLERDALSTLARRIAPSDTTILVAATGTEALQFAREHRIDAALLDIRMPGVNGLDAAAEIRALYPKATIVFLSAFDYFEYAQRAIRLDAFDYLVKPVDDEAVMRVIRRVLDRGTQAETEISRLEEARRFLESEVFDDIIAGDADDEVVRTAFRILNIEEAPGFALVFRPHFERYSFPLETASQRRTIVSRFLQALRHELANVVVDVLAQAHPGDGYALLIGLDGPDKTRLHGAIHEAGKRVGCPGIVSLRGVPGTIAAIAPAFAAARSCIARSPSPADGVIAILDECHEPDPSAGDDENLRTIRTEQELLAAILKRDVERSREAAEELWRVLAVSSSEESQLESRIRSVVSFLVHTVRLREEVAYTWFHAYLSDTFPSIHAFKRDFFDTILALANRPAHLFTDPLARRMHDFIESNYTAQIGLGDLARHCGLSDSHCSRSFSVLFGESFSRYLNRRRLRRAKELLTDTDRTIGDIAITAGFRDPAYFSRVFARMEGIRAAEYRRNHSLVSPTLSTPRDIPPSRAER